jgi:outer membrane receptor for ferrienterochelin and colicin
MSIFILLFSKYSKSIFGCFLCFCLLHGFTIQAQNDTKTDKEVFELFDVSLEDLLNIGMVSASKKKQSVADAPATAYVFSQEQIRNRGYTNLSELIEDVPEIEIQRNSNPEYRNIATVRGISGNEKLLILLNGIRITPATGDGYTLASNFSLANAKRVEVIIGPASALYGVDAFSGIVNIITRSQENNHYRDAEVVSSYGQFNSTNNSFTAGTKAGKLTFSLSGNYYASDEPNYSSTNPEQFKWYNKQTQPNGLIVESPYFQRINSLSAFEKGAGASFQGSSLSRGFAMPTKSHFFNADFSYGNFTIGYARHYESHSSAYGIDPRFTLYDATATIGQKQEVVYGKHTFTSFNKKWGLQSTFTQSTYETNPESNFANASSRWQRGYIYSNGQSSKVEEQFNYDFSSKISFLAGALYEHLSALPRTGLSQKPFDKSQPGVLQDIYFIGAAGYNPTSSGQIPVFNDSLAVKQNFYYLNYQNYGGFAQFQLTPWKFLEITLGSRYDYNTRFGGSFNPRAGFVFLPNKKFRFKVLYGEAYLAPSPKKAYEQAGSFYSYDAKTGTLIADYFRTPNVNLKPEKLKELEANTSYMITQNISVGANGFYTRIENLIDQFALAPANVSPKNIKASRLETSVNQGSSETYGGTLKANVLNKWNGISFNWFASFSYIDGNINNQPLLLTAKNTAKGGVEISHKRFAITPRFIYRSSSLSTQKQVLSDSYYSNDAYAVVHLFAYYLIVNKERYKIRLTAKVNNITNNKYYNVFSGNDEGMGFTPQDPTRTSGGIVMEF